MTEDNVEKNKDINNEDKTTKSVEDSIDYKDKYIRLLAEFENYRKQTNKQIGQLRKTLGANLVKDLIIVLDDFEKALENKDSDNYEGLEMLYNKLKKTLESHGLEEISANVGDDFEAIHDAVVCVDHEMPANKIVEVVRKGYKFNDVIIRHPQVIVSKEKE